MVQLIKKGGLRERANRSRSYQGSENTETTLKPNHYSDNNRDLSREKNPKIEDKSSSSDEKQSIK